MHINRVAKVVKGGRRFGFAALVVVGDQKGRVGFGHGKAREVPEAIRKATEAAKRSLVRVPLREGRTLHHDVDRPHGAGKVVLRSAPPGTGIIAGGPMRAVFESLGMQDVVAKSMGTLQPLQHGARDLRCAEEPGQPARRRRAPRQEGERDRSRRRDRDGGAARPRVSAELRFMSDGKDEQEQDHDGRADRQPDAPPGDPARDADRPWARTRCTSARTLADSPQCAA